MQDIGMRELLLILFPITALVCPWSSGTIPFLLAFLAFASCLPSVPLPGDLSFDALLVVFAIHVWQLHFPRTPSPIFLLPFDSALPLCTLLWHSISRALYPILKVFLPVLVLTWFLLYLSLADTFLQLHHLHGSPIDTRIAFFVLFLVELLVLIPSLFIPVLIPPTTSSVDNPGVGLDRYSTPVGLDARKAFLRAVMTYASPHYFPTPVHVLRLLIRLFSVVLRPINLPPGYSVEAEKLLWRVVVGPVAAVIGGLWQL
jgi:hypothetical protein